MVACFFAAWRSRWVFATALLLPTTVLRCFYGDLRSPGKLRRGLPPVVKIALHDPPKLPDTAGASITTTLSHTSNMPPSKVGIYLGLRLTSGRPGPAAGSHDSQDTPKGKGLKDHINIRVLQAMVSGIPGALGLRTIL